MAERQIVAIGGGWFCEGMGRFLAALTGKERPRALYVGTASAEHPEAALRIYDRFGSYADLSRLEFFPWPPQDLRSTVLDQDLIFVGGGNTANMLHDGLPGGYAADAGVGLHFVDGELHEVVACDEGSKAYRVDLRDGEIVEEPIEARIVG